MEHEYFVPCTQCGSQLDPVTGMCPVCDVDDEDLEDEENLDNQDYGDEDLDPEEEEE